MRNTIVAQNLRVPLNRGIGHLPSYSFNESVVEKVCIWIYVIFLLLDRLAFYDGGKHIAVFFGVSAFLYQNLLGRKYSPVIWLYIFVGFCSSILAIVNNSFNAGYYFFPMVVSAIAAARFFIFSPIRTNYVLWIFLSLYLMVLAKLVISGNPDYVISGSRNHISTMFLFIAIFYYTVAWVNDEAISLWPAVLTFLISVITIGTSGIISSAILVLGMLLSKDCKGKNVLLRVTQLSLLSLAIMLASLFFLQFIDSSSDIFLYGSELLGKFDIERILKEDTRYYIWQDYLSKLTLERVFIGVPFDESFRGYFVDAAGFESILEYNNLHSSYFALHKKTGIFFFVYITIVIITIFKLSNISKFLMMMFISILVRGYSDTVVLAYGHYEWIFYMLTIIAFSYRLNMRVIYKNT